MKIKTRKIAEGESEYKDIYLDINEWILISEYHSGVWKSDREIALMMERIAVYPTFNPNDQYDFSSYELV